VVRIHESSLEKTVPVPNFIRLAKLILPLSAGVAAFGCQPVERDPVPEEEMEPEVLAPLFSMVFENIGLSTPESVLHDPGADVYLVSNVSGDPWEEDGNGFVSRLSPDGQVLDLKWIDGTRPGVTLNAPKGMAIVADTLFVADIDCIRKFEKTTGNPFPELCFDEGRFLNDLTSSDRGILFFSDSGAPSAPGAVFLLRSTADVPQKVALADGTVLDGEWLGGPNGVFVDRSGLYVATFQSGQLFQVTPDGERVDLLGPSAGRFDGVVALGERGTLVSSWGLSEVVLVQGDGSTVTVVDNVDAPADIGFDAVRNRLLIPLFRKNEILVQEIR
jgi:hypothetical protein